MYQDQLNIDTFCDFFWGGGGAKFKFAPGSQYPRYATASLTPVGIVSV